MSSETPPGSSLFRYPTIAEYLARPPHALRKRGGRPRPDRVAGSDLPLISIVTVVFNGAATLERTVKSVAEQDYPNIEYVVVDGGSTDGTVALLERLDARIDIWISEPDKGIYDAMNKALSLCGGEWILFVNADDLLASPGILSELARRHLAPGACDVLLGNTRYFSGGRDLHVSRSVPALMGRELCINHTSALARRSLFLEHGLYSLDFRIISDNEWFYRVSLKPGVRFQVVDTTVSRMNLAGLTDARWPQAYRELHRMRLAYGMPRMRAYALLAFQCTRTYIRKALENRNLSGLLKLYRNRFSRINRHD